MRGLGGEIKLKFHGDKSGRERRCCGDIPRPIDFAANFHAGEQEKNLRGLVTTFRTSLYREIRRIILPVRSSRTRLGVEIADVRGEARRRRVEKTASAAAKRIHIFPETVS